MKPITPRVLATVLSVAGVIFGMGPAVAQPNKSDSVTKSATIKCGPSDTGECQILLYTQECKEGPVANTRPSLVCTLKYWQEFTLKVGEVKVLNNPPPGFKQCHHAGKTKPVFPACAL